VPDYRGVFLRGFGSQISTHYNSVVHSSGTLGILQGDAIRNITGTFPAETENNKISWPALSGVFYSAGNAGYDSETGTDTDYEQKFGFDTSRVVPTANEVRPINISVRFLMRSLP
jgi:hypothetical protein